MGIMMAFDTKTSTASRWAATFALVAGVAANASAQSVYLEGCNDGPTVEAALAKDGQKPVFIGKRLAVGGVYPGNAITMNDNGYGFNLERNPADNKLCVRAAFKDVQLNYPDNPNIPTWGQSIKPNNGIDVQKAYSPENGGRLVLRAQTYSRDASGKEILGKAIVVMAQPLAKKASVWSVDSKNVPDGSFSMVDFGIVTTNFNQFMGRGFGSGLASNSSSGTIVALRAPEQSPTR
jgi:hypothetical protein